MCQTQTLPSEWRPALAFAIRHIIRSGNVRVPFPGGVSESGLSTMLRGCPGGTIVEARKQPGAWGQTGVGAFFYEWDGMVPDERCAATTRSGAEPRRAGVQGAAF
jgi:hypothetical protein